MKDIQNEVEVANFRVLAECNFLIYEDFSASLHFSLATSSIHEIMPFSWIEKNYAKSEYRGCQSILNRGFCMEFLDFARTFQNLSLQALIYAIKVIYLQWYAS